MDNWDLDQWDDAASMVFPAIGTFCRTAMLKPTP
jgi:hypothetical protein